MNSEDVNMARFCHWILTMSEAEAAFISRQCLPFREDKEKVAAYTVMYYRNRK